jgi:hypothetical protein
MELKMTSNMRIFFRLLNSVKEILNGEEYTTLETLFKKQGEELKLKLRKEKEILIFIDVLTNNFNYEKMSSCLDSMEEILSDEEYMDLIKKINKKQQIDKFMNGLKKNFNYDKCCVFLI